MTLTSSSTTSVLGPLGCRLWIDGVGCWQLWFGSTLTIGGGAAGQPGEADFGIQAALSRKHCQFQRLDDDYQLVPFGLTAVNAQTISEKVFLPPSVDIALGDAVQFHMTRPSVLSRSAVLRLSSSHRPVQNVDGIIMLADNILLGAGPGVHITCPQWAQPVVLFRRRDHLYCQPQPELKVDEVDIQEAHALTHGSIITVGDLRARLEVPN